MHTIKIFVSILLSLYSSAGIAESFHRDDIVGFWLTPDKKVTIHITKNGSEYEGRVVWIKKVHEGILKDLKDIYNKKEELRTRPIMGMKSLYGFKFNGKKWNEGKIYDPKSGSTYSSYMYLESKKVLNLRGYIGLPLFGKTKPFYKQKGPIPDSYIYSKKTNLKDRQ